MLIFFESVFYMRSQIASKPSIHDVFLPSDYFLASNEIRTSIIFTPFLKGFRGRWLLVALFYLITAAKSRYSRINFLSLSLSPFL